MQHGDAFLGRCRCCILFFSKNVAFATKKSNKKCSKWYFFDILLHKNTHLKKASSFFRINKRFERYEVNNCKCIC